MKENNYKTIEFLEEESSAKKLNIAIADASTEGFELPEKEGGVGLARKIGMDLALRYFDYSSDKKNILICLDADCAVEKNYLREIYDNYNGRNLSAAVLNFDASGCRKRRRAAGDYQL